ncbi:hypothetical protein PC123_g23987 [Phytophthora cactorum]|nr:hypothetical protein PC123_g23987 [Phytophthora cactorum]
MVLATNRVIAFGRILLSRLVADNALGLFAIELDQRIADGESLASQTTWNGFESSGSIWIGADGMRFFIESNAAHVTSFFNNDDSRWANLA